MIGEGLEPGRYRWWVLGTSSQALHHAHSTLPTLQTGWLVYFLVMLTVTDSKSNKTLRSVHFGVVVVELIKCKCGGIVRNEIW